ncbi:hypothetical protein [Parabacteroides sp.]
MKISNPSVFLSTYVLCGGRIGRRNFIVFSFCFTVKQRKFVMKATIKIELRKDYATKEGKQMVCLRYTAYRRSTLISMNIAVYPKHWNKVSYVFIEEVITRKRPMN